MQTDVTDKIYIARFEFNAKDCLVFFIPDATKIKKNILLCSIYEKFVEIFSLQPMHFHAYEPQLCAKKGTVC